MTERLVFESSVQGMLKCLGTPLPADVKPKLLALGVNPDRLLPAYTMQQFTALMALIGELRYPTLSADEKDYALGQDFVRGFGQTLIGKATFAMAGVLGPLRTSRRLTHSMRTVNNYTNSSILEEGPDFVRVWIAPVGRPHFYRGVFDEAGRAAHLMQYRAELTGFTGERADFTFHWKP